MENKVKGPAIGLMVTAIVGVLGVLYNFGMTLFGPGVDTSQFPEALRFLGNPAYVIVSNVISLGVCGFLFWAALQMKALENRTMSYAACIVAMIPCFACCCIGLPIGIWGLVVLNNDEVKAAFKS